MSTKQKKENISNSNAEMKKYLEELRAINDQGRQKIQT